MGIERYLLEDAASFVTEVRSLDEDGFVGLTLAGPGIPY
jgi:hypothetical protein